MSKPNKKHKEGCQNYLKSGRRTVNKAKTAEKQKKREEKARQRRADGKAYVYERNPYEKGTWAYEAERNERARKAEKPGGFGEVQRWARIFGRLNRDMERLKEAERQEELKKKKEHKS